MRRAECRDRRGSAGLSKESGLGFQASRVLPVREGREGLVDPLSLAQAPAGDREGDRAMLCSEDQVGFLGEAVVEEAGGAAEVVAAAGGYSVKT